MALTVNIDPQPLMPAYNPQVIKATSNQTAVADFKYIVTIEVNGGAIFTEEILPAPDDSMTFDAMEYVKNYIEHYFNPSLSLASPCALATNKTVAVEVKVKEYYTSAIQSTNTINYEAFDACLSNEDFEDYNYENYIATGSLYFSGLNSIPTTTIDSTSDNWLHFINDEADPITNVIFSNNSETITIAAIPSSTLDYPTYVVNVTQRMFTAVDGLVRIRARNAVNSTIFTKTFTVTDIDTNYTAYKLYYLDTTGNVLFFNFELVSNETLTKKTNSVRLANNTGNSWEREKHIVSTQTTKTISLNSNWITETQSTALANLLDSPIVWLYLNQVYTPITITDTTHAFKKYANESLFNYTVTCEYGLTNTRQRGI
jgi:hypothetical protein